jgi:hypothetical protein
VFPAPFLVLDLVCWCPGLVSPEFVKVVMVVFGFGVAGVWFR